MACCPCCCGGEVCAEGQQGKCCCNGTCCQPGETCVNGACQSGCCVTATCSERQLTQSQCEEGCYRSGSLDPGGSGDQGFDLSAVACTAAEVCFVYTNPSDALCPVCPPGAYRVDGQDTTSLCLKVTTDLSACPDFDPYDPLADPLCVCYSEDLTAEIAALGTWEDPCSEAPPP